MKKIFIVCTFLLLMGNFSLVHSLSPKKAFLIGGGCDEGRDNFTTEFNEWNNFLESYGWEVRGFIDDNKQTAVSHVEDLDWENFKNTLNGLADNPPKQVLVGIITHGNYADMGHGICVGENKYESVAELAPIFHKLQAKGIQVGVIDMSCHSGYSVRELAGAASCVVSMAGEEVGSGSITSSVAMGLSSLPTLGDSASMEDVWFSVLENSNKRLRQVPQITGFPEFSIHGVNAIARTDTRDKYLPILDATPNVLERVFSENTMRGIEDYFIKKAFFANHHGILGVMYLNELPNRQDRPCANFYF